MAKVRTMVVRVDEINAQNVATVTIFKESLFTRTPIRTIWPGTGKWITRTGKTGFGVKNLVKFIKNEAKL